MEIEMSFEKNQFEIISLSEEQLLSIYENQAPRDFPADELKSLSAIKSLLAKGAYSGLGLFAAASGEGFQKGGLLGYALFLQAPGSPVVLLDYYAVLPKYRNLGLGGIFLDGMKKSYALMDGILLETEDPDTAADDEERDLRSRRNGFYLRGGARMTDIRCALFHVAFRILYLPIGSSLSDADVRSRLEEVYRFMLPAPLYDRHVEWYGTAPLSSDNPGQH